MCAADHAVPPLTIHLFGPFEARVNGMPLPRLRTRKGQWLLALLALRHDRDVERSWLAGTLWPDSDEPQALQSLRMALTDLRRALGAEAPRILAPTNSVLRLDLEVPAGLQARLAVAGAVMPALLLPAVQKVREAASRSQAANNLKQMALAMHNFNDAYQGRLPAHAIYSRDGKPLLSWRVAILPYIDQDQLYRQFKLNEPWDSEHNRKLIPLMPKVYLAPNAPPTREPGLTYYQVFVGGGAPWERGPKPPSIPRTFVDGTSNTIMIAEAGDPVVWSKPDDLPYDPTRPLPKLGNVWNRAGFLVALADGSVRTINPAISEKTLRAAITAAGNETLGPDW